MGHIKAVIAALKPPKASEHKGHPHPSPSYPPRITALKNIQAHEDNLDMSAHLVRRISKPSAFALPATTAGGASRCSFSTGIASRQSTPKRSDVANVCLRRDHYNTTGAPLFRKDVSQIVIPSGRRGFQSTSSAKMASLAEIKSNCRKVYKFPQTSHKDLYG